MQYICGPVEGEDFRCFLRRAIRATGMTIAQVADVAEVNEDTLSTWTRLYNNHPQTIAPVRRLAAVLPVREDDLVRLWETWRPTKSMPLGSRHDSRTAWVTFKLIVQTKGGEVVEPDWLGVETPHHVRCAKGHDCYPTPSNAKKQRRGICNKCGYLAIGEQRKSAIAEQYGWLLVIGEIENCRRRRLNVKCLLCGGQSEMQLGNLICQGTSACKSCAHKLARKKAGQLTGVSQPHRRSWVGQVIVQGKHRSKRGFLTAEDAARWADKVTYEGYGHTIFLNFPKEYDQSSDPVFVAV